MAYPPDLPGKEDLATASNSDLSPSATTVAFEPILPLLRVPVRAGADDDPSKGPCVLAFEDEISWRRAWRSCEEQVTAQCEAAAMKGCSIRASKACSPAWWKPFAKSSSEDRDACEEKAMVACLAASREEGVKFARGICEEVFGDARLAKEQRFVDPRFTQRGQDTKSSTGKSCPSAATSSRHQMPEVPGSSTTFRGKCLIDSGVDVRVWPGGKIDKSFGEDSR